MSSRLPRRARVRTLEAVLETARQLQRVSGWLVRRASHAAGPDDARELTAWRYAHMPAYLESWHRETGLFDFERSAIERYFPQPPAHLLVHGAGAGREALALLGRGYGVTAAEPVSRLAEAARRSLGPRVRVVTAGLQQAGSVELSGPFAGVIVGWSAYGHVLDRGERVEALRALRVACPDGPILLSWREGPRPGLRGAAQTVLAAAGDAARKSPRAVSHFGIFHAVLDESSVRDEAARAGSELAHFGSYGDAGYPHAVLQPRRATTT